MTGNYPDLGSASDWLCCEGILLQPVRSTTQIWEGHFISDIEYLQSFLRCYFAGKLVVASQNVGCFLSLMGARCQFFTDAFPEPYSLCITAMCFNIVYCVKYMYLLQDANRSTEHLCV